MTKIPDNCLPKVTLAEIIATRKEADEIYASEAKRLNASKNPWEKANPGLMQKARYLDLAAYEMEARLNDQDTR